jgi:hypothetical protein
VGSLLCGDLEEELASWVSGITSALEKLQAKKKVGRAAYSAWDEPCMIVATKYCERRSPWFCLTHFAVPDWHSCTAEEQ